MTSIEAPTNEDPDAAEGVGTMQLEAQRPPPPMCGLPDFAGWNRNATFAAAVNEAQQQAAAAPAGGAAAAAGKKKTDAEEGWQDPQFQVLVKDNRGRMDTNGKVIYISGFAPSSASSSSKVDSWSRMKSMRLGGDGDSGAQLHPVSYTHLTLPTICSV